MAMTAHLDIAENGANFESVHNEIPEAIARDLASWRRTIENARDENARDLLWRAAVDLFRASAINKSVNPESVAVVNQEIADWLHYMANVSGVDPDDAQLIFFQAKEEPLSALGQHTNGHNIIEEPPP